MKYTILSIIIFFGVLFIGSRADAVGYIKYGGVEGELSATSSGESSGANTGTIATEPVPPPGGSRDIYLDIEDIEGDPTKKTEKNTKIRQEVEESESAAGPALLEIDTIRGESPENSSADSDDRLKDVEPKNDWSVAVNARELKGWDAGKKQEFVVLVKATAEVKNEQDLQNFAKGILLKDENIESIEANKEKVKIVYKMPARFLGIFETSLNTRAEIARDRAVKVTLPWYSFLFKKHVAVSSIKSDMEANLPEVGDEVLVLFETQARTMTALSNIMKTKHDTVKNSIGNIR